MVKHVNNNGRKKPIDHSKKPVALIPFSIIRVGIGEIGDGRGFSAYRPNFFGEVGNFTDFFST
jgi:hypothetical protein